jgi:CelD/BcsL family acetyltransferase involved in cellulose biosynthesis
MPNVQVARLSEQHLAAVVALEREIYPVEAQESESLIAARLRFEDEHYSSLNLGLFEDDRLVGYILAHLDDGTEFPEHPIGDNVYVADIAVRPLYRRHLIRLLQAFTREVRIEYPGLPVVAHSIHGTSDLWEKHAAIIQRLGGRMATRIDGVKTRSGATASLIVWRHLDGEEAPPRRPAARTAPMESYPTASGRRLGIRVVDDEDGLLALGAAWRRIEDAMPHMTVFQTHRYQCAWVRNFGLTRRLMIVVLHDGDEVVGIAPFQVSLVDMHGRELRQLSFLGAPWEVDRPGFLFPQQPAECAEAAAQALLARRGQWDFAWFHEQIPGDPALESFCAALSRQGLLHGRTPSSRCPYLRFEGTWPELLARKSQKFRKNLKAARRKLEAAGKLGYETCSGDVERLQGLLLEYEALERRSWKAKAGIGAAQSVEHLRFYLHLASEFGASGDFTVRCLRLDGRMIAATFGITHRRRFYSLHIANDSEFAKHSAGTYLEALELEECFGAGLDEYDFLGGFLKNKLRWSTEFRDTVAVHLYQRTPFQVAVFVAYFKVKAPLKRLLARLGITWEPRNPENRLKEQA